MEHDQICKCNTEAAKWNFEIFFFLFWNQCIYNRGVTEPGSNPYLPAVQTLSNRLKCLLRGVGGEVGGGGRGGAGPCVWHIVHSPYDFIHI